MLNVELKHENRAVCEKCMKLFEENEEMKKYESIFQEDN